LIEKCKWANFSHKGKGVGKEASTAVKTSQRRLKTKVKKEIDKMGFSNVSILIGLLAWNFAEPSENESTKNKQRTNLPPPVPLPPRKRMSQSPGECSGNNSAKKIGLFILGNVYTHFKNDEE
jgi:hypothetical protein